MPRWLGPSADISPCQNHRKKNVERGVLMEKRPAVYNRNVLYREVWSEPVYKLAHSYGVTGTALAKICKKLNVPLPPLGYWEKRRFGHPVDKPPLPATRPGEPEELKFGYRPPPPIRLGAEAQAAVEKGRSADRLPVGEELIDPHRLVAAAERTLRNGTTNERGLVEPRSLGRLDIRVSPGSRARALRIMDALIKWLEQRGHGVAVSTEPGRPTEARVLEETIRFWLEEKVDQTEKKLTPTEIRERKAHPLLYYGREFDYHPTGLLVLRLHVDVYGRLKRKWSDGEKGKVRLESRLEKFIEGLITAAELIKQRREEDRVREINRAEEERRRWAESKRRYEEEKRREALDEQIQYLRKSRQIRSYVAAVRRSWEIQAESKLDLWLTWAERRALEIDPREAVWLPHDLVLDGPGGSVCWGAEE